MVRKVVSKFSSKNNSPDLIELSALPNYKSQKIFNRALSILQQKQLVEIVETKLKPVYLDPELRMSDPLPHKDSVTALVLRRSPLFNELVEQFKLAKKKKGIAAAKIEERV